MKKLRIRRIGNFAVISSLFDRLIDKIVLGVKPYKLLMSRGLERYATFNSTSRITRIETKKLMNVLVGVRIPLTQHPE